MHAGRLVQPRLHSSMHACMHASLRAGIAEPVELVECGWQQVSLHALALAEAAQPGAGAGAGAVHAAQ